MPLSKCPHNYVDVFLKENVLKGICVKKMTGYSAKFKR